MDSTLVLIGAIAGAVLLSLGALIRHRAGTRLIMRDEAAAKRDDEPAAKRDDEPAARREDRPGLSPVQESQGAPPEAGRTHRSR